MEQIDKNPNLYTTDGVGRNRYYRCLAGIRKYRTRLLDYWEKAIILLIEKCWPHVRHLSPKQKNMSVIG